MPKLCKQVTPLLLALATLVAAYVAGVCTGYAIGERHGIRSERARYHWSGAATIRPGEEPTVAYNPGADASVIHVRCQAAPAPDD